MRYKKTPHCKGYVRGAFEASHYKKTVHLSFKVESNISFMVHDLPVLLVVAKELHLVVRKGTAVVVSQEKLVAGKVLPLVAVWGTAGVGVQLETRVPDKAVTLMVLGRVVNQYLYCVGSLQQFHMEGASLLLLYWLYNHGS